MTQSDLLQPLVDAIETVKKRIAEHGPSLRENETRTRVALIDPILQALGWDVSEPGSVTLEFDVQGRRADYALLRANNRPAATIEAKKLGEALATHRMQMLNYANASGVDYAGLTDGNHWELYDVFKRGELSERELLSVTIADAPSHESALKLLRLWQPSLESGQPVEAAAPIVGVPTDSVPAPQRPPVTPYDSPLPDLSEGWTPLGKVEPTRNNRPSGIKLPDGTHKEIRNWAQVGVTLFEWQYEKGELTVAMLPLKTPGGSTLVDSTKRTRTFAQAGAHPIYIERHGSGATHARRWRFIASKFGFDLNSVLVQIR